MKFSTLRKTLVILALLIAVAVPAYALSGAGTQASPYQIAKAEDLKEIANYPSAYFKQTANIVLNDVNMFEYKNGVIVSANEGAEEWTPVDFSGYYNGNGKYITGLYVSADSADGGLFKTLSGATVTNLYLDFALIESDECAGIIAAKTEGKTKITNVVTSGSVIGKTTKVMNTVGGIVGKVGKTGTVENCASYASVAGATSYSANIGGITGINEGEVEACSFGGTVFGTATYYDASIGGIVGYNTGDLLENRNQGTVAGESTSLVNDCYVGGIAGVNKGYVEYCTNEEGISVKNYSSGDSICGAGGIAGITIDAAVSSCTNLGEINGPYSYCGGIAGIAISDNGTLYLDYNDNFGDVSSSYGVAGGIIGRAAAAGEGYVSIKLYIDECYNNGALKGNAKGTMCGEIYEVESASVTVSEASAENNNSTNAIPTSKIVADEYQYGATPVSSCTAGGTVSNVKTNESDKWIIRYTVSGSFAPASKLVTLTTITDASKVEILKVDASKLTFADGKISGSIFVRVYMPESETSAVAVAGISVGNKFATSKFATVDASAKRVVELTIPVDCTIDADGIVTVNTLIVGDKNTMDPLCENKVVTK